MHQGPYLIPAGAPPGTPLLHEEERPPEAVYYFRIYAVLMVLFLMLLSGYGLYLMLSPIMNGSTGSAATGEWVIGLILFMFTFCFLVPHVIALFGGRRRWVYTLSMILIGLNLLTGNFCCMLVTVPLLIYWMKPETKRWYGAS